MTLPPSPTIDRCKTAVLQPLAFVAGAKLDIFTALASGPATAADLSARLEVALDWLEPLLYALVAAGLIEENHGHFSNTAESDHFLVRGRPHFIGDIYQLYEDLWLGAFKAAESVQAERPLAAHDYGSMDDEALNAFFRGQHPESLLAGWKLADHLDLSSARRLADIGGGSGGLAIALCQANPALRGAVLELPDVARIAQRRIDEAGCADRLAAQNCDLLSGPLEGGYDVTVMRSLLQVFGPEACVTVLRNIRPAMVPGAPLYIIGQITDDDRVHPAPVAMFNLIFLGFYPEGRARTEAQHRSWLEAAGFHDIRREVTPNGLNMMIAHA